MDNKIKQLARIGFVSKGVVYLLTGVLALGSTFGVYESTEGKIGVIKFLKEQSFGKILLLIIGIGLLSYAFWRCYQSFVNPENISDDSKGLAKRAGFFISGLIYGILGLFSIYLIFNSGTGSGQSGSSLISPEYATVLYYLISFGLLIKSIFQFVKVYKGDFLSKFGLEKISEVSLKKAIKRVGYIGLVSRGILVAIVAYFFFRAAGQSTNSEMKGTSDAFSFINNNTEGPWLVALVAIGLVCYGIYMFTMARYRKFQ